MLSISAAQLDVWLAAFFFPLTRLLALLAASPPFNNVALSPNLRRSLGLGIALALTVSLPSIPAPAPGSWSGMLILFKEMMIGAAMGLSMRLAFAALELAGDLISFQMGFSFAVLYDPQSGTQTGVITDFLTMLATMVFLSLNGHLAILDVLVRSFTYLPVSAPIQPESWLVIVRTLGTVISLGFLLALPFITALMVTTISLAILTRAAPQLNIFSVGFPITICSGLFLLIVSLNYINPSFQQVYDLGFATMNAFLHGGK